MRLQRNQPINITQRINPSLQILRRIRNIRIKTTLQRHLRHPLQRATRQITQHTLRRRRSQIHHSSTTSTLRRIRKLTSSKRTQSYDKTLPTPQGTTAAVHVLRQQFHAVPILFHAYPRSQPVTFRLPTLPCTHSTLTPRVSPRAVSFRCNGRRRACIAGLGGLIPKARFRKVSLRSVIQGSDNNVFGGTTRI